MNIDLQAVAGNCIIADYEPLTTDHGAASQSDSISAEINPNLSEAFREHVENCPL